MAEALYRKYRPQIFEDVVGQEHIERTIKNAIAQDKVSHAYLFTGPRGTGKTTTARLLAKALLCEKGPTAEPDGTCDDCEMIAAGEHPDVYELDAASRTGVENVREEIIGRVQFAPTRGRYKVYIIDEVHMLSTAAFNALLKTLEEPPSHVVFILATTDPQKVPETIHSRCQRFDFRRISTEAMVSRLGAICTAENVEFEGEALELIAHRAEGGMRNALTSLEQLIAFGDGAVTMEVAERMLGAVDSTDLADIVRTIGVRDAAACFRWVAEYVETGADMAQFVANLAEHMRNMYVMAVAGPEVVLDVSETTRRELIQELPLFGVDRLARLLGVLGDVAGELKTSTNPRLTFEIALTRMVRPDADVTLEALAERVETLERQLAGASVVAAAAPASAGVPVAAPAPVSAAAPAAVVSAAVAPAGASPVGGDLGRPSAPAGSAPCDSPSASLAEGRPRSAPTEEVVPAAAPAAATSAAVAPAPSTASAPVSAPPASAAAGALSPEITAALSNMASLQRLWAGVLASLKKSKAAYGVLFMNTKAVFDAAAGALLIEFPAENDFAFRAVQKPDVQAELAQALRREAHGDIPFELRKGGASAPMASAPAAASAFNVPAPASQSVPAPSAASASPMSGAPSSVSAPAVPASAAVPALSPAPAPDDDRPPYDDYVPYDDADIPFEDPFASRGASPQGAATFPAPSVSANASPAASSEVPPWEEAPQVPAPSGATPQAPASAPAPSPAPSMAAPSASALPPEPDAVSGPSPNPVEEPDLAASLAFGFGDGVNFEEVV
ncbi:MULTISPECIES: DNA polymerase III subunit gamma/tau [Adlercreutzia]|uniref:DNA polymerase III subunit gamma/tau n=1 Tax=Adlercreutzia rubneri TaxID=2916441 RepID=A0A7K1T683_9ACTN|nr:MULTISPECIES: DNA polymerase III subunit gamma/tau [Adlercreutzia]RDC45520.1 DNA polymerase III subunit gamma/tau [Adlercreutzia equolifaciens subsp. celatus]MCB6761104.1 DNA polymerase III subunit gamma/tau [Adlercreutzia equolifaciens]MCB6976835.1 DNA polymerase III subunit gamma/tau [Adlercreutzia equolifaciens]MCG4825890.1 DNA polymerase III subunit gamma/tau [Adlercreutzia equolifaciens]MCQ5071545.1 DNA polymerase III subunit gamma/tau [Adlercreutzia sp. DFI.6.23]